MLNPIIRCNEPIEGPLLKLRGRRPKKSVRDFPLCCICGGAAAGKTATIIQLMVRYKNTVFLNKKTTRDPRPEEREGSIPSDIISFREWWNLDKKPRYEELVVQLWDPDWIRLAKRIGTATPQPEDVIENMKQFLAVFMITDLEKVIMEAKREQKIVIMELRLKDAIQLKTEFENLLIFNIEAPSRELIKRIKKREDGISSQTNIIKLLESILAQENPPEIPKEFSKDYYQLKGIKSLCEQNARFIYDTTMTRMVKLK